MKLAQMTSPEVEALPGETVVVFPVASLEQHRTHLPVFTDSMIAQVVLPTNSGQWIGLVFLFFECYR